MGRILRVFSAALAIAAAACSSEPNEAPDAGTPPQATPPDLVTEPFLKLDLGRLQYLFGERQSYPATITALNKGGSPLRITFVDFFGANTSSSFEELDFAPPPPDLPATLAAADAGVNTLDLHLLVTPTSGQQGGVKKEWAIVIKSNDPQEPERPVAIVAESILGPACQLQIAPRPLDFGTVAPQEERTAAVSVQNVATYRCVVKDVRLSSTGAPEFTLPAPLARAALEPDAGVDIAVHLTAGSTTGPLSSEIVFDTANAPGVLTRIPVAATVQAP